MVFQDPMTSLHPMLSVGRQLTEHVRRHPGAGRRDAERRAEEILADVRIPDPAAALAPSRISSPAACASASRSPSPSPAGRGS